MFCVENGSLVRLHMNFWTDLLLFYHVEVNAHLVGMSSTIPHRTYDQPTLNYD